MAGSDEADDGRVLGPAMFQNGTADGQPLPRRAIGRHHRQGQDGRRTAVLTASRSGGNSGPWGAR